MAPPYPPTVSGGSGKRALMRSRRFISVSSWCEFGDDRWRVHPAAETLIGTAASGLDRRCW